MSTDSTTWEVAVEGDPIYLEWLARHFTAPPRVVARSVDADEFVLRLDSFESCSEAADVLALAERQLLVMSGLLRLERRGRHPLRAGAVVRRHSSGRRDIYVSITESVEARCEVGDVVMSIRDAAGNPLPATVPATRAARVAELAAADSSVEKVIRLLAASEAQTWVGLYRIYEVVESDVDGQAALERMHWGPAKDQDRFKHSANSVTAAGDQARHGKEKTHPPKDPMSLEEAGAYVENLIRRWLESKGV